MTAITLNDIQSGYNVHKVNNNFTILKNNINNDVLHTAGGGNTMNQDIDMDGNSIFNLATDSNNSQSAVSVQYLREFTGVDEGIGDRVSLLEVLTEVQVGTPTNTMIVAGDTVQDALWKSQGQLNAKLEYKYIGTWAGKPTASTLQYGDLIFVTDHPIIFGSVWIANPLLNVYIPQTGNAFVAASYSPSDSDTSGTDQILKSANIPAAFLFAGIPLDFDVLISKSGATDSATIKLRIGTEGDLTDPVIATFSMSAAQQKLRLTPSVQLTSATSVNCQPELATDNTSNNAWLADVTIPDISNALIISLSVQLSGTTDTATVQSFYVIQRGMG